VTITKAERAILLTVAGAVGAVLLTISEAVGAVLFACTATANTKLHHRLSFLSALPYTSDSTCIEKQTCI
jgi:hypothetical protein